MVAAVLLNLGAADMLVSPKRDNLVARPQIHKVHGAFLTTLGDFSATQPFTISTSSNRLAI
jgi:hypothetical protein